MISPKPMHFEEDGILVSQLELYPKYDYQTEIYDRNLELEAHPLLSGVGPYLAYSPGILCTRKYCRPVGFACDEVYDIVSLISKNPLIKWFPTTLLHTVDIKFLTAHLLDLSVEVTPMNPQTFAGTWAVEIEPFVTWRAKKDIAARTLLKFPYDYFEGPLSTCRSGSDPIRFSYTTNDGEHCGRTRRLDEPVLRFRLSYQSLRRVNENEPHHWAPAEDNQMPDPEWLRFKVVITSRVRMGSITPQWNKLRPFERKYRVNLQAAMLINHRDQAEHPIFTVQVYSAVINNTWWKFNLWYDRDFKWVEFNGFLMLPPAFVNDNGHPVWSDALEELE